VKEGSRLPPLYKAISEGYAADPLYQDVEWINLQQLVYRNGMFYKGDRVAVPDLMGVKIDVLIEHHDSLMGGHLGTAKTHEKVARLFWWVGLHIDVENHIKTCPACQVSKHRNWKPQGRTGDLQPATSPMEVMHLDFAGPFKTHSPGGYNRVAIFTDAFTKLAVFVKCRTSLTSEGLADLYIQHIWRVYGRVAKLVSDNEPILCAQAWMSIHQKLGTKMAHIAAYNAKANGAAEVMVKQMKTMLAAFERQGLKWWRSLPACEKAYNDSVHSATGYTPFYMVFGRHPLPDLQSILEPAEDRLVQEFINSTQSELARVYEDAISKVQANSIRETARRNAGRSPTLEYKVGDYVYLETSALRHTPVLAPLRAGPYLITQVVANGNAVCLEGFRRPFNVEFVTPTICYANGMNPHLTQHQLDGGGVTGTGVDPGTEVAINWNPSREEFSTGSQLKPDRQETGAPLIGAAPARVTGTGAIMVNTKDRPEPEVVNLVEQEVDEGLGQLVEGEEELPLPPVEESWEFQPMVRIVPGKPCTSGTSSIQRYVGGPAAVLGVLRQPEASPAAAEAPPALTIVDIPPHVILPAQLPGDITAIQEVTGRTRNSATLLCLMSNGQQCRIGQRHLTSILGREKVDLLFSLLKP